ncbi:MAG TPA: hypothetical protein VGK33_00735, partial [Chloroflexota bacterium]
MANAVGWIRRHPGILVLLAALLIGQVGQRLAAPYVAEPVRAGEFPVVPASVLAVAMLLAIVAMVARVRLGNQMLASMRARSLSLPAPESLPARYALTDPPRRAVAGTLALVDVVLLLLILSTLRDPVLAIAGDYVTPQQSETVFVAVLVLLSLVALVKLYRTGGPVLLLLLWWGLDRVVPTAGFLGARPSVAPALAGASRQQLPAARQATSEAPTEHTPASRGEPTYAPTVVAGNDTPYEPTVVAERETTYEPTVVAGRETTFEPTVVAADAGRHDATIVAPLVGGLEPKSMPEALRDAREDITIMAPLAPHAPTPTPAAEVDIRHDGTVIVPQPARREADTPPSPEGAPAARPANL